MSESDKIKQSFEEYKKIQERFLDFIDMEENIEENFINLKQIIEDLKIRFCQHKLRLILYMILQVADHHYRGPNFFSKIEQTLQLFKDDIKRYFSNSRIFDLFRTNKRILLFLIEEKILTVDEYFVDQITMDEYSKRMYPHYFAPEIKHFLKSEEEENDYFKKQLIKAVNKELPENFNELRKKGENDSYLCELIRKDLIKDFLVYVNKNSISLNSTINKSIYETNSDIINFTNIRLIEYAAFFGSIQILTLLKNEGVKLDPNLWYYSIHGKNAEIIHLLEENGMNRFEYFETHIKLSLKFHHNDIANYFINCMGNMVYSNENYSSLLFRKSFKYYNFLFIKYEQINETLFCKLCCYDYYSIVEVLLESMDININNKLIHIKNKNNIDIKSEEAPLYLATKHGNFEIVKLLLKNDKLDINIFNTTMYYSYDDKYNHNETNNEETTLFLAAKNKNIEIVKLLLTNDKLDINLGYREFREILRQTRIEETPLHYAVEHGNIEIIKLLLANDKLDINHGFIEYTKYRGVKNTGIQKYEPRGWSYTYYSKYDQDGNVSYNVDDVYSYDEQTPLDLAVGNGNIEIVKLLLTNDKLDINFLNSEIQESNGYKQTTLFFAIEDENIEIVKLLLANDKVEISFGYKRYSDFGIELEKTPLYLAVEKGNIEIVKLLLMNDKLDTYKIDYKSRCEEKTALYLAVEEGNIEIIKLLLENDKLDINILNIKSEQFDKKEEEKYFKKEIEEWNKQRKNLQPEEWQPEKEYYINHDKQRIEKTALYLAVEKGDTEIVNLLLANDKLDINILNTKIEWKEGRYIEERKTALNLAVQNNNADIIKLLQGGKNDIEIEDSNGKK